MRRKLPIFYSALLLTGVNLLLRLVGTGFQVYLSGIIGPAGIGRLQLVLSVTGLAAIAGIAGIRTATMYLTAEEIGRKRGGSVLSGCMVYSILCAGAVAGLLWYFAPVIAESWIGDGSTAPALRMFAGFLPVICLCGVFVGYFTASGRIGTLAVVEVGEQLCTMVITVGLLKFWAGSHTPSACLAVVLGNGLGSCFTLLCLAVLRLRETAPCVPAGHVPKRLLNTAAPLAVADILKAGISTTENLIVPRRLALYAGAQQALSLFGMICGMVFPIIMFPAALLFGLTELLIPELARCAAAGSRKRIHYLTGRSLRLALLYGTTMCGLLWLGADRLGVWLYKNSDVGQYLRWFAPLVPMLYCDAITDAVTKGLGQQKLCVVFNIITTALDVLFLFFLLPKYGVSGYFISFLLTHVLNFLLSLGLLLKITQLHLSPGRIVTILLCCGLCVWTAGLLPSVFGQWAAFLGLYGAALFCLRVIGKEDVQWLGRLVRRLD